MVFCVEQGTLCMLITYIFHFCCRWVGPYDRWNRQYGNVTIQSSCFCHCLILSVKGCNNCSIGVKPRASYSNYTPDLNGFSLNFFLGIEVTWDLCNSHPWLLRNVVDIWALIFFFFFRRAAGLFPVLSVYLFYFRSSDTRFCHQPCDENLSLLSFSSIIAVERVSLDPPW